jgi:predicted metalloprotease
VHDDAVRTRALLAAWLAVGLLLAGCAQAVAGRPSPAAGQANFARVDVAEAAVEALQTFWRTQFPAAFGHPWRDISHFVPVHAHDRNVPCVSSAAEVADQAFYCPSGDAVVWDADGLIPKVQREDGPTAVMVVLAHEVGHAVQTRLGLDELQARQPSRYPTILLEAMADCYAGVALAHFAKEPPPGLSLGDDERDQAMAALVAFRDPLGVSPRDSAAHGNAFDRVSAFQDGYDGSATSCSGITTANHPFTQRTFGSATDKARQGNLPPDQLLDGIAASAPAAFTSIAAAAGATGWRAPSLGSGAAECATSTQGPAAWCGADEPIAVDRAALAAVEEKFGDYAGATLIASRYGLAVLDALGRPVAGSKAGAAATCLAGAYTGGLFDARDSFTLSPGDLDEAVEVLLVQDWADRDAQGAADPAEHGYERIDHFRTGVLGGANACL